MSFQDAFNDLLDAPTELVFNNGVLELTTQVLSPLDPNKLYPFTTGINYVPLDINSCQFKELIALLEKFIPEIEKLHEIIKLFAIFLDGSIKHDSYPLLSGSNVSGKKLLLDFIQKAMGDYYNIHPFQVLTKIKTDNARFQNLNLMGEFDRRIIRVETGGLLDAINKCTLHSALNCDPITIPGFPDDNPVVFTPRWKYVLTTIYDIESIENNCLTKKIDIINLHEKFECNNEPLIDIYKKMDELKEVFNSLLIDYYRKFRYQYIN